ncbi:probable serine/threonine-protein kinase DDB_G0282963 isoform X2 [Episyrphus balteatus]|uniref:probable serine/threonine-protein kinase DDB_G0282963 isoform X2 n=1 Tax=Episyrphus balteatus TaxID=286459 RepID=UPI002486071C|nr:probable serine/threonine-protein kinase DDB_G0282963 isoform X2 [Episyrphus balteatus]
MRINQSPHWRALAVLGALLSVIIVWPTVLSMPILTARTPTTKTTTNITIIEDQNPSLITSYSNLTSASFSSSLSNINTVVAPNDTLIQINRKQITNFSEYSDYGSYLLHLNVNTSSDSSSEDQDQYNDDDDDEDQDIDVDEHHLTHDRVDIDPLFAIMTDGNVSNSRRVKKSNMVYNKRKRKKNINKIDNNNDNNNNNDDDKEVSANEDVSNTTYLSSASISDYDSSTVSNSLSKINNNNINSVSVSDVNSSDEVTAAASSSIISHHYQSKRTRNLNKNDYDYDNGDVVSPTTTTTTTSTDDFDVTSDLSNLDHQTPTTTIKITIKSTSTTTTPSTTIIHDDDNNDNYLTSTAASSAASSINAIETRTKTLTHTELPVLSRTDRSVHTKRGISLRHRGNTSRNNNNNNNNGGKAQDAADGGVSIKPRRLNNHNKIHNFRNNNHTNSNSSNLDRNERSTISHISGPGRKIQLYIKNRFIQLMTDGTVNGTQDDLSDYTILQRTTVDVGRIKIQGVATCLYLCMDQCGAVYGSKEFTDDCVFNESMEQHNYNTYSSTYNSNSRRIYYLALNRHGEPRKLQIPPSRSLGKLATYTKAITETVPQDRVETLIAKIFGANRVKHGIRQLCDTGKPLVELTDKILKARPQCTATSSNSNSNSNNNNNNSNSNSNKNGQLNVPAANDKSSNSSLTNSSSNSNSSSSGHTSGNSNNNHVIKKKKKKRRCRPGENEDEHNCQRGNGPQAIRKRPNNNNNKMAKCKEAAPDAAAALECANQKRPKKGGKKQQNGGPKHKQNGGPGQQGRRGGKKLNQNGRQQQGGSNSNKKNNGKQPKNGLGGGERTTTTTPTTIITTTTAHPIINNKLTRTPRSRTLPPTMKPKTSTSTTTTTTTTTTPATTLATLLQVVNSQQTLVSSNQVSSQFAANQTSSETQDADNSDAEDITAEDETGTGEAEEEDLAMEDDDTSSHLPFIAENTQLVGGADDFLYDDDLDL